MPTVRKRSIPQAGRAGRDCGGVLHLRDALVRYPDAGLVIYNRVSSWGQAGRGKVKLDEKTDAIVAEVNNLAPDKLRRIVGDAVEVGKLSEGRPKLIEAAEYAVWRGLILVSSDLSRFIRSEAYSRRTNREAWPTPEEFAKLREMTGGAILATLLDPAMTEAERHSRATKRTNKCGRKSKVRPHIALPMLEMLESNSLQSVADFFELSKPTVQRFWDYWKNSPSPTMAYRIARKQGILTADGRRLVSKTK